MKNKNMESLFQTCFHPLGIPVWCAVLSTMGVTSLWQWAIKNSLAKRIGFNPKGEHMGAYAPMALKYASTDYVLHKYFYPIVCNTSASVCCAVLSTMGVTFLCQWAIKNSPCQKVGFDPLYYHSGRSTHRSHHFNFLLLKTSRYASWIMSCTISQFYSTPLWCVLPDSCLVSYCNGQLIS